MIERTDGCGKLIEKVVRDENGNQVAVYITEGSTTEQTASYSYDLLNRMIEATAGGDTVTYTYSGDGLRVSKYVDGTLTNYIYEYDKVVLETDGYGNEVARNIYGTNLLMRTVDNQSYYYMYNGHADVTALINATTRAMDATYYYDAFGNIMESTGNVDNNITYAGYQYDEETGLYYLNARMYDPKIARFLQEDTYRGDPNDPLSLNLYTYVKNNPLVYYDPTGHNYIEIFGIPFGNPLEGLKILSDPQKREEAYDLIEEHGDLNFAEKRFYSLVTGYGEISAGMIKAGRDVLDSGYVQKPMLEAGRKLGFIDDDLVYEIMKEEIDDKLERNKKTLKNAPKAIYNGIIESASNVVNKENAYNFFINPDTSFNELVDYSRDTISTGLTVYGGAKMLQSGHNLLKSIRVETIPSAVTSFRKITPSTLSVTIDAGLAGNLARSAGFLGGINFATTNNKGTPKTEIKYPGNDPSKSPGPDWEWRGKGDPGSGQGSWYNPKTGESLHPDLNHPDPIGPHWDYQPYRSGPEYRLLPDGTLQPK